MPDATPILEVDPSVLEERVRVALRRPGATLESWGLAPVAYQNFSSGGRAVHRVSGHARDGGARVPWSMIVKAFELPQPGSEAEGNDIPSDYAYWKREPLAFESGTFSGMTGGLRAPDCYGVDWHGTDRASVWLEALADEPPGDWPIERYGVAARHLGRFNGAYLGDGPLSDEPWLASARSINDYWTLHPNTQPRMEVLRDLDRWAEAGATRLGADGEIGSIRAFLDEHETFIDAIERLPQVACHNDAMRSNLFATPAADGTDETAAIDWGLAGLGPVGGELAMFVAGSVMFFKVPAADLGRLEELATTAYLRGVADAGASVDEDSVRFGHATCTVLRMTAILGSWLQLALAPADADWTAEFWARPVDELLGAWGPLLAHVNRQAKFALESPLRG